MKTQFGNILLRRRKELGFTQEYIAKALHLSAQAISKWERGETMPDILLLPALADLLQTSTDELLGIIGSMERLSMPTGIRPTSFIGAWSPMRCATISCG